MGYIFTDIDFANGTAGLAHISTLCRPTHVSNKIGIFAIAATVDTFVVAHLVVVVVAAIIIVVAASVVFTVLFLLLLLLLLLLLFLL